MTKNVMITLVLFFSFNGIIRAAQPLNQPDTEWFKAAKFGMFIHWGLYAEAAGHWNGETYFGIGEWLMKRAKIKTADYEILADKFNPEKFDADEWVQVAKNAGMKYMVITAKHHDGFAMFKSEVSEYNIVDATKFKRDPLKELAEACKKEGIKLGFYYSQYQDWHEPGGGGNNWEFPNNDDKFDEYFESKCKPQVKELLINYGELGLIWFDTPGKMTKEQSMELVDLVRKYQPNCLVSSRVGNGVGDYIDLGDGEIPSKRIDDPWEALFTHNDSWGYVDSDKNWKSSKEIVQMLSEINGKGGNFLLNVGPKNDGTLPEETVAVFKNVGSWIDKNKAAVYGSSYSLFPDLAWGTSTTKPGKIFLQIHCWPENNVLNVPGLETEIRGVKLLASGKKLSFQKLNGAVLIDLPNRMPDPLTTVIELEYSGEIKVNPVQTIFTEFKNRLQTSQAEKSGQTQLKLYNFAEEFGDWKHAEALENWKGPEDAATWIFNVSTPGAYRILLDYSYPIEERKTEGIIEVNDQQLHFETLQTGTRTSDFYKHTIGVVNFSSPGKYNLQVRPAKQSPQFIQLRNIEIEFFN